MTYDPDNIFAKILRGEAPAHVVEEDEFTLTMMDIMPRNEGHTLVIPKEAAENIFDVSETGLVALIKQTQRVARAAEHAFECEGVMVVQLNRTGAGQSVFHLHFHVIPSSGGLNMNMHGGGMGDPQELKLNAEKLKHALNKG